MAALYYEENPEYVLSASDRAAYVASENPTVRQVPDDVCRRAHSHPNAPALAPRVGRGGGGGGSAGRRAGRGSRVRPRVWYVTWLSIGGAPWAARALCQKEATLDPFPPMAKVTAATTVFPYAGLRRFLLSPKKPMSQIKPCPIPGGGAAPTPSPS